MFWDRFIALCNEKGVTPSSVGRAIGLAPASVSGWKQGAGPRSTTIRKLADYFGVPVESFHDGYREPGSSKPVRIPVLGNVAAGIPIEAVTDIEDWEEIAPEMAAGGEYIALRIHGRSMEPRMLDGDVVIVRLQETINSGEIAIVSVNGDQATCKKVRITDHGLMLLPLNPDFEPMFYTPEQVEQLPVKIIGKVVELRGKF